MEYTAILLDLAAVGTILLFGYIGALGKIPFLCGLSGFVVGVLIGTFFIALVPLLSTGFYKNLHENGEKSVVVNSLSNILSYSIFRIKNM